MNLVNILSVTTLLVLLYISGVWSITVTLSKSAEKGQLGNNSLSLYCDYTATERVLAIELKRKRADDSSFDSVVAYYEDNNLNATYFKNASDLEGRTVLTNPTSANRRAILQFSSIQCRDEADYRCELLYSVPGQGNRIINDDTKIVVTATPMFVNQSLLYTPSTNLAENQNVTFTCRGNVGREPQGTFSWYKYVGGQPPGMVITNGIKPVSLTNVAGSCTYLRTEHLILTLTKEDNKMVIRCTVQQTTMTEAGDGNIQTDHICVYYVPRINTIRRDPNFAIYSEGLVQLLLTCNADSNPTCNYVWTLPDGTEKTGYQLSFTNLTTNHTGKYTCMAYTEWGGQNYTANRSIDIIVVATTTQPHPTTTTTTTTTTRSSTTVSTKKPVAAENIGNVLQAGVRSATVTLSKSAEKGQLGNNSILLYCDYILSSTESVFTIDLKRKRADDLSFNSVVAYYEDNMRNAAYYSDGLDLVGRTVLTNPTSANRRATLQFSSIQCTDEADYRCELMYASEQGNNIINSDTRIVVTATPFFGNQILLYTLSTSLAENQNVTFTCSGNVGREPQGTFSWYKYVGGQASGIAIANGIKPVSLTNVAGSCTYVRTENLILTLTKEDNLMVIRCTVRQTTMTEAGDGNIQTDRISVYYVPRINPIRRNPDNPVYSEGLVQLLLTCNADSNPPSNYVWTLPDGTVKTGNQLRLTNLTTSHTGRYTCMAYTSWDGQNYTANSSIDITVVATTTLPHPTTTTTTTTTTTRSSITVSTMKPVAAEDSGNVLHAENTSSTLFAILFGVVLGVSVFLVTILLIFLHKQRMLAADFKHQLQTRSNTYDGLNMRLTTPEPYAALTVERSDDSHLSTNSISNSSAYSNPYEGLHRTLENSEPYDSLEKRI